MIVVTCHVEKLQPVRVVINTRGCLHHIVENSKKSQLSEQCGKIMTMDTQTVHFHGR